MKILKKIQQFNNEFLEAHFIELVLLMTLLTILLFMQHTYLLKGVLLLMIPFGILFKEVARSAVYWSLLAFFVIVGFIPILLTADNHIYLTVYWIAALAVSLWARDKQYSIEFNARLLIGLCFGFATLWKILSPEFLDGTFFYFTFLTDSRFFEFAELTAGITRDMRAHNVEVYEMMKSVNYQVDPVTLKTTPILSFVSIFMAYWTVFIEGWIAVSFLLPVKHKLSKWRDIPLVIFMITTYPVATVRGFATLLAVMAFAQCYRQNKHMRIIYLLIFLGIPLFKLPFEAIIMRIMSLF